MTDGLVEFLLACIAEDEANARLCAEMFPPPWEVADRGWRVRVYASDVPIPDLMSDDEDAMTTRSPVVMEVEPDRKISDTRWLSDRVEHVVRHDPARVLAECEFKRHLIEEVTGNLPLEAKGCQGHPGPWMPHGDYGPGYCRDFSDNWTLRKMGGLYSDRPGYRQEWTP